MLFADLLWRTGWSTSRTVLLVLFVILFWFAAVGCMHGVYGFFLRTFGTRRRITALKDYRDQNIDGTSTAIVFPIYNENVVRVYEGLRATYESLERTGQLERFDFFILSDSTDPDKWVEEERRWHDLIRELGALGKIYYRRRLNNEGRKSGNVRDFLNAWGRRYRYFMVLRRRQRHARRDPRGPGEIDGGAPDRRPHPDRAGAGQRGIAIRPHPAICQPPLRARLHRRAELLGARPGKLLGAQRHHPHRAVHAILRPAATARAQAVRRPDFEPRFRRGGAAVARKLGGLARLRPRRQLRGGAADDD